ncbi:LytTR family DNA-binding domain-containing protein [Cytophagaceae bacterium DM2B3-1]|uniref:LytTR family DNA-binding domain-containing protein n=1 Tax=Xanthocytophaga flava TaxID=3048013 RepID=A0ABT7CS77_9BACT|nr:LytTR family DNA-binding domain-containing protein [Xanthocytophaga flavus]MDJ1495830.1 LytTR family DNA-binding domain-containing protein [Xanthocytophaga flavus]
MLNQPYPFREVTKRDSIGIVLAGLFVAGFLVFFQPFGIYQWNTEYKVLKIAGYGLVTILVLLIDFYGIRLQWISFFNEKSWKVWKEIGWVVFILLSVTIGNYLYNMWILDTATFRFHNFLVTAITTFSIGIFPTTGFVLANYIVRLRHYSKPVEIHSPVYPEFSVVELIAENEKDRLVVKSSQLLYIESADNYCTVCIQTEGRITKELIRSSLTRLESQVSVSDIIRCHRSYIVNLEQVTRISGNAQGYKLHLSGQEEAIPVARKYAKQVLEVLQKV